MNRRDATTVKRILIAGIVLAAWVGVITWRLVDLQLLQHQEYVAKAAAQQKRIRKIPAVRGSILDRNGNLLTGGAVRSAAGLRRRASYATRF